MSASARPSEDIEHEIARLRRDLVESLTELDRRLHARMDWRAHVRRHPVRTLSAAFTLGFWLARR